MKRKNVIIKLICPICDCSIWEHTEHDGEFRCVRCGKVSPCEHMFAVSQKVVIHHE